MVVLVAQTCICFGSCIVLNTMETFGGKRCKCVFCSITNKDVGAVGIWVLAKVIETAGESLMLR